MIFNELLESGLDGSLAIDIGTVLCRMRPFGLAHISELHVPSFLKILDDVSLKSFISRSLFQELDPTTGHYQLSDFSHHSRKKIIEIWFSHNAIDHVLARELVCEAGKNLGYPTCCVNAYESSNGFGSLYQKYILNDKSQRQWRINRFSNVFSNSRLTLDYLPCSLNCEASTKIAYSYSSFLDAVLGSEELQRRTLINKTLYGIIGGILIQIEDPVFSNNVLAIDTSNICRSNITVESLLSTGEVGLLSFEHNAADLAQVDSVIFKSGSKSWKAKIRVL